MAFASIGLTSGSVRLDAGRAHPRLDQLIPHSFASGALARGRSARVDAGSPRGMVSRSVRIRAMPSIGTLMSSLAGSKWSAWSQRISSVTPSEVASRRCYCSSVRMQSGGSSSSQRAVRGKRLAGGCGSRLCRVSSNIWGNPSWRWVHGWRSAALTVESHHRTSWAHAGALHRAVCRAPRPTLRRCGQRGQGWRYPHARTGPHRSGKPPSVARAQRCALLRRGAAWAAGNPRRAASSRLRWTL
jgi:hypothetical protein